MSYKIAVASYDGVMVDAHFGSAPSFFIFEIEMDGSCVKIEKRMVLEENPECEEGNHSDKRIRIRISLIEDCRSLLCKKIGAGGERELLKKGITAFSNEMEIEKAMKKVIAYYTKIDNRLGYL